MPVLACCCQEDSNADPASDEQEEGSASWQPQASVFAGVCHQCPTPGPVAQQEHLCTANIHRAVYAQLLTSSCC